MEIRILVNQSMYQTEEKTTAAPMANCASAWLDLMKATDMLLLAGLRRQIGPEGNLQEEYRRWYADHMEQHDEALRQLVRRLHRNRGES
jgi:hypothetical protein